MCGHNFRSKNLTQLRILIQLRVDFIKANHTVKPDLDAPIHCTIT